MSFVNLSRGGKFYLDDRMHVASVVSIEEIADSLSKVCRFTGHCKEFYSVAQHSVIVSNIAEHALGNFSPMIGLDGLMHDSSEAILADLSSPVKELLPDYQALEKEVEEFMRNTFSFNKCAIVKKCDLIALATERRDLLPSSLHEHWPILDGIVPLNTPINPLKPTEAAELFMQRWNELKQKEAEHYG